MDDKYKKKFLKNFNSRFSRNIGYMGNLMMNKEIPEFPETRLPKVVILTKPNSTKKYLAIQTRINLFIPTLDKLDEYLGKSTHEEYTDLNKSYRNAKSLERLFDDFLKNYSDKK